MIIRPYRLRLDDLRLACYETRLELGVVDPGRMMIRPYGLIFG